WAVPAATQRTLAAGAARGLAPRSLNPSRYDEPAMPRTPALPRRTGLALAAIAIALIATACGSTSTSAGPASASPLSTEVAAASPSMAPPQGPGDAPPPPAVPGGVTVSPGPPATHKPTTTNTDWGVILDAVPDDFPRYPGAKD